MRGTFCMLTGIGAFLGASLVFADSIVLDGKRYENVYIGSGATMYYIQNPVDGSMISVPKSIVSESDITITADRSERRKLREMWKAKREQRSDGTPLTISYEEWQKRLQMTLPSRGFQNATTGDEIISKNGIRAVQSRDGAVQFTNRPKRSRSSTSGRPLFMGKDGVAIMTNRPEQFRGRDEYVEVIMHFDLIDVPKRFRPAPTRSKGLAALSTFDDIVEFYAKKHRLDKNLVYAVIKVESGGNQYAVSPAGARGLMQLMPGTAREMGVNDIFDAAENVAGGTQYLSKLLALYKGDTSMALAGYNAGPGNVKKYGGIPPFKETQNYIRLVQRYQRRFMRSGLPQFDIASSKPVDPGYLPPESDQYYKILLENGLTVTAEEVYLEGERYIYIFKGRSGHFPEREVRAVYEPS